MNNNNAGVIFKESRFLLISMKKQYEHPIIQINEYMFDSIFLLGYEKGRNIFLALQDY